MKKLIISVGLGSLVLLVIMGQSTIGTEVIKNKNLPKGASNNFTTYTYHVDLSHRNLSCEFCHSPKNSEKSITVDPPLWSKQSFPSTYTIYPKTIPLSKGNSCIAPAPDGTSSLCLSCHDGIVSANVLGENPSKVFGNDLNKHHPISIDYNCSYNNGLGDLRPPSWVYNTGYDVANRNYAASTNHVKTAAHWLDANGKVQCTSCHCMHGGSEGYLLCMNNLDSKLCLVCHDN